MNAQNSLPCDGCRDDAAPALDAARRPGLDQIPYRLGTYGRFLEQLLADISRLQHPAGASLRALKTRAPNDPAIALLDAWAAIADVLTFYQERIANEGFLRTATERRSVLELARAIGYELNPGVAASAYLAFTVEDTPQSPRRATVPQGTQVQSIPGQNQLPQTFETAANLETRAEWNALRPRLTQPQSLENSELYLAGLPSVAVGDFVAVVSAAGTATPKRVVAVFPEPERQRTRLVLDGVPAPPRPYVSPALGSASLAQPTVTLQRFTETNVHRFVLSQTWREADLSAFLSIQRWDGGGLVANVRRPPPRPPAPPRRTEAGGLAPPAPGLYHFRTRTNPFGYNAPRWDSLPLSQRYEEAAQEAGMPSDAAATVPYPEPGWDADSGPSITTNSRAVAYDGVDFYCDRPLANLLPGSLVLLESQGGAHPYQVQATRDTALADYALSAKATGVAVTALGSPSLSLSDYRLRTTTIHADSQPLPLAAIDIAEDLGQGTAEAQQITLEELVLGLQSQRPIAITGELSELPGVSRSEIALLKDILHTEGRTTLQFAAPLQHRYRRQGLTLNGNVALASHGETVAEVLGSGDGSQANQRFRLKKPPLTHVAAATPSGAASTLEVRVNGILWEPAAAFFGAAAPAEIYTLRIEDDGTTQVIFGDGQQGARLPTGSENITARYRSGSGSVGEVAAASLSLLKQRPLGVRSVSNPLAASGAEDPETLANARQNAPLTVHTLDRIVSLQDYESFARAFAGIGKAQATPLWDGRLERVHITVASASGLPLADQTYRALLAAMESQRDPTRPFVLDSFLPRYFNLSARLRLAARFEEAIVLEQVRAALLAAFGFARRSFGQGVSAAEVVTQMQRVPGVVAVDLDDFYRVIDPAAPASASLSGYLESAPATWDVRLRQATPAELLLINPVGLALEAIHDG